MITYTSTGKFSTYLAGVSFVIGSLLLAIHLAFPQNIDILILGFYYVLFAFLFNFTMLLSLFGQLITIPLERENILIRILILLSNIPIALLYLNIVFHK